MVSWDLFYLKTDPISITAYSIYSQLTSISRDLFLHYMNSRLDNASMSDFTETVRRCTRVSQYVMPPMFFFSFTFQENSNTIT